MRLFAFRRFSQHEGYAVAFVIVLSIVLIWCPSSALEAQNGSTSKGGLAKSGSSEPAGFDSFSIETEMLTYRALEANSEAIACDVTGVLNGGKPDFEHHAVGAACAPIAGQSSKTIVLLPFEKSVLEDFAAWRAVMADMSWLQDRAKALGCPGDLSAKAEEDPIVKAANSANPQITPKSATVTDSMDNLLSLTPLGSAIGVAQSAIGLFADQEQVHSVTGTVQNIALLNNVARQLKVLNISVLTPSSYGPESMTAVHRAVSPFWASKERTELAGACLADVAATDPRSRKAQQAASEIESYFVALTGQKLTKSNSPVSKSNADTAGNDAGASGAKDSHGAESSATNPAPKETGSEGSETEAASIATILRADELAKKLGFRFNRKTGELTEPAIGSHYILMLQTLESGGSVTGRTSILGTSLRYSGGAVGTYAIFSTDGDLACSGNVYNYVGSFKSKHFVDRLKAVTFDPVQQVVFRSSCPALPDTQQTPATPTTIR